MVMKINGHSVSLLVHFIIWCIKPANRGANTVCREKCNNFYVADFYTTSY